MISLIFSIFGLCFWLAIKIISIGIVLALDLCVLIVNAIIGFIELCLCGTVSALINKSKPAVNNMATQNHARKLSRQEQMAIKKRTEREIRKAQDDLEYDMLMMMEVFMDD